MIPAIELAEATAELNADYAGTPEDVRWVVTCDGYRRKFHTNLAGRWATPCADAEATHFDSIHEAGAACRAARLTGVITIDPVSDGRGINGRGIKTDSAALHSAAKSSEAA